MKKLQAFTLMELLVGMIISSIVIGFGYGVYSLMYKQYSSYKIVKREVVGAMQLNSVINNDFSNAEIISFSDNKLTINRHNKLPLQYDFSDSLILRKDNEITDTFKIVPGAIVANYIFPDQKAIVKIFSFDTQVLKEAEHYTFNKDYSAETLMNYEVQNKN